jgi:chromosome segregation ATPase
MPDWVAHAITGLISAVLSGGSIAAIAKTYYGTLLEREKNRQAHELAIADIDIKARQAGADADAQDRISEANGLWKIIGDLRAEMVREREECEAKAKARDDEIGALRDKLMAAMAKEERLQERVAHLERAIARLEKAGGAT